VGAGVDDGAAGVAAVGRSVGAGDSGGAAGTPKRAAARAGAAASCSAVDDGMMHWPLSKTEAGPCPCPRACCCAC